ncbi:unnamed protein product [Lupinus luteus]|uniref:Fe2OG dioxygenase domain-containing protein n=1 Tax=Lupinus luteus TaxID=3873 RepID=A0AAV1Y863_LUPLU
MESTAAATLVQSPSPKPLNGENNPILFDENFLQKLPQVPEKFQWPSSDLVETSVEDLNEPLIDIGVLQKGDEAAIAKAAALVRNACIKHGFFQVTNHGVNQDLISAAYEEVDTIFNLPLSKKLSAKIKPGLVEGYSGAHADRFTSKLPWKETFSFKYSYERNESESQAVDYFNRVLGEDMNRTGLVYQKYCEAMTELSLTIMELLAISLGLDRKHFREYFKDGEGIMRCNLYPPCNASKLTLGTGPHSDPISLTLLHQDQVGGLEVYVDNKWLAVRPRSDAFVINIGDTFMALTNGIYKSCLHRALVNSEVKRKSLVYFVSPKGDKTVRPPESLIGTEEPRKYPDFKWADLFEFTQKHHRADVATLQGFIPWLQSSKPSISN